MTQVLLGGRYRLGPRLARGGMGTVYRAHDEVLGRLVAVKVLAEELAEDPEFIERFRREARNAAALLHPNIAGVFDYGSDGPPPGRSWMVMELVDGQDLASRIDREGRLPWPAALAVGEQVAAALAHAHARGVVHRDVKPANILVTADGQAKVTDFGIALAVQTTTNLTRTGSVLGTPSYLAPEQAKGERVGPPADQYSLGVVLFEALTGSLPFHGESGLALAMQHVTAPVPDPRERGVALPDQVAAIVVRAMAKDPAARFTSTETMRAAIRDALGPRPRPEPVQVRAPAPAWDPPVTAPLGHTPPRAAARPGTGPPPRRSRRRTAAVVAAAVLLALVGILVAYRQGLSSAGGPVTAVTRVTDGTVEVQIPIGLVGHPFDQARRTLGQLGFEVAPSYEFSADVAKDSVIEVSPDEGGFRERGGRVLVTVSKGRGDPVRVPGGIVGASYGAARSALINAGLAISRNKAFSCAGIAPGAVESASPPEGATVQRGTTVNVWVC